MKTILIPTDFSDVSTHAAKYGAAFCDKIGISKIILYHSYKVLHPEMVMIADVLIPKQPNTENTKNESIQRLIELKGLLEPFLSKEVVVEYLADERPFIEAINEICIQEHVDLVVMGISGVGNKGRNVIGNHTFKALKESNRSLLIVPLQADYQKTDRLMFACDIRSTKASLPIKQLKQIMAASSSKLRIVNVVQGVDNKAESLEGENLQLQELLADERTEYHQIIHSSAVKAMLELSEKDPMDLLIAAPRKKGILEAFVHKSVTENLAVSTHIPLLILKEN